MTYCCIYSMRAKLWMCDDASGWLPLQRAGDAVPVIFVQEGEGARCTFRRAGPGDGVQRAWRYRPDAASLYLSYSSDASGRVGLYTTDRHAQFEVTQERVAPRRWTGPERERAMTPVTTLRNLHWDLFLRIARGDAYAHLRREQEDEIDGGHWWHLLTIDPAETSSGGWFRGKTIPALWGSETTT